MLPRVCCFVLLCFLTWCCTCYHMTWGPVYNSFDQKYDDLQPQDIMVDYINRLGLYLLNVHNEDNLHNNIALSPYGAVSVLIALAEGLRGDAALEIYRASHIPHDLTIIRIGLRDIHRHLKTYFIPREGFLAGLTLSHENVTLSTSYERILRFYGYDLESFRGVKTAPNAASSTAVPIIPQTTPAPETRTESRISPTEMPPISAVTIPVVEITTGAPQTSEAGTETASTEMPARAVTIPVVEITSSVPQTSTAREARTSSTEASTEKVTIVETTSSMMPQTSTARIVVAEETTVTMAPTTEEATTEVVTMTTVEEAKSPESTTSTERDVFIALTTESEAELITTTMRTTEPTTIKLETTPSPEILEAVRTMSSANLSSRKSNITGKIEMITAINIQTQTRLDNNDDDRNAKRNQRSIIDYLIARYYDDYYIPKKHNFPKFFPRIPFFVDGVHRIDRAHFMTYDTILPFFYMPNLDAVSLSFPLDSTHYYLLLILPLRDDGIDDLICDLKRNPDLKYIIRNMKYTRVKAVIPSFRLKGHVNLTPSLQRLGIQKIFEPQHADFTPMTNNKDVYVTNIEQAITVTIRNYVDLGIAADHGDLHRYAPVEFKADHPFLYFVMDSQMHVALMAGKVMDPLNSRIR